MFADYHVHSEFSDDSEYRMEDIVEDALEMGMNELCFTDHVDYGVKRDLDDPKGILYREGGAGEPERMPLANVNYPRYMKKIRMLQEQYKKRLTIRFGMEFGMQRHTIPQYESLFRRYPFDFIILSVHQIENKEFWTGDFQRGHTQREYYMRYYRELLSLVENYHDYSVLGHMDLISRYDPIGDFPLSEVEPILEQILKRIIADGKGIEVNTSCYRYGLEMTPCREILRLYHDLGGEILTIGSDSHKPEHLGMYIPETMNELKSMGFRQICTFEYMKPKFHLL
ncbi:MAG: histidinol-phosphatase HisJ family protein [Lachnospiraceae bacterium]|nr:histidinol-phosphatase HisJ family protein [Lachnospiraceae bacterium]